MKYSKLFFLILFLSTYVFHAQDIENKKSTTTHRVAVSPKIDGILDDVAWEGAEIITDFVQNEPTPGIKSSQKTEVKVVYSDNALFVGAHLFDTDPDSILHQFTERDNEGNSDLFGFWLSPYQDGINAFLFISTPEGVQIDMKASADNLDYSWNAVWKSAAKIVDDGWIVEFEIPYSAIRFPSDEEQEWDINFMRNIRRNREQSFWNEVSPDIDNFIIFSGHLQGIKNIEPPLRLFFYPYASSYYTFSKKETGKGINGASSFNAGMDLKYGINDAFTLDLTLIPDFGQVQSDNLVLNLSAFEVEYDENRQFFNEGTELFNKGDIFYSRRIGGEPINAYDLAEGEEFVENQQAIQLLNATKVSGRTDKGLGIGVLNALTKRSTVVVRDSLGREQEIETSPLTNYNIVVFDQNLKNNSYVSLINTNVMRNGSTYDANVVATDFRINNKENSYAVGGTLKYSQKYDGTFNDEDQGYSYTIGGDKIRGNFQFGVSTTVESEYYDPNDFGILFSANEVSYDVYTNYNIYKPFWKGRFNRMWSGMWTGYSSLFDRRKFTDQWIGFNVGLVTRSFFSFGVNSNWKPRRGYDYYEPREAGRYYRTRKNFKYTGWFSSDYRKKFALDGRISFSKQYQHTGKNNYYRIKPRFRLNDHLELSYILAYEDGKNKEGYTTEDEDGNIFFATRDVKTRTNIIDLKYVVNNRMAISGRIRHYWSTLSNKSFYELTELGELIPSDFDGFDDDGTSQYDKNFNSLNADIVYSWVFAPGSEMSVVWKTQLTSFGHSLPESFQENFNTTFGLPKSNTISLKVLYFIDYNTLRKVHS